MGWRPDVKDGANVKEMMNAPNEANTKTTLFWSELSTAFHRKQVWGAVIIALLMIPAMIILLIVITDHNIRNGITSICQDRADSLMASLSAAIAGVSVQVALRQVFPTNQIDHPSFGSQYVQY